MAKKEVGDAAEKAAELKRELKKMIRAIIEGEKDDSAFDAIDRAKEVLCAIRDLKTKKTAPFGLDGVSISYPEEFKCPLSKQLMRDPVIVATGQTFWIKLFSKQIEVCLLNVIKPSKSNQTFWIYSSLVSKQIERLDYRKNF